MHKTREAIDEQQKAEMGYVKKVEVTAPDIKEVYERETGDDAESYGYATVGYVTWLEDQFVKTLNANFINAEIKVLIDKNNRPHCSGVRFDYQVMSICDRNGDVVKISEIDSNGFTLYGIQDLALPITVNGKYIYNCDERAGKIAYDSSGAGRHAKYV